METTHTTLEMTREEMLDLLTKLNVTTTLVRLADTREDHTGICGAFSVRATEATKWAPSGYSLRIDLRWSPGTSTHADGDVCTEGMVHVSPCVEVPGLQGVFVPKP